MAQAGVSAGDVLGCHDASVVMAFDPARLGTPTFLGQ